MPPKKKFRSGKRKKGRFGGNRYTTKENSAIKGDLDREVASESSSESEGDKDLVESKEAAEPDKFKSLPASVRKLKGQSSDSSEAYSSEEEFEAALEGFRLVDISVLASVFECLRCPLYKQGHLKKRLGKTPLEDGKSIGGIGRLTNTRIDKLQVYYGKAIRENTDSINSMKQAVMAIWHHSKSTDENPEHDLCPPGADSWCGFQRDQANGTTDYLHDHPIPEAVADAIYPTFEALSDESLLSKCLHGGTQNQNEALNGMIWQRATKETHSSLPTVELATFLAVSHFNDGARTLVCVLKELGIVPGAHCRNACTKLDQRRLHQSRRKSTDGAKRRRKQLRNFKKGYTERLEAREGPSYGYGTF